MKAVTVKKNQTIFDIAIQEYGNINAWMEIVDINQVLTNDPKEIPPQVFDSSVFDIALPLLEGSIVNVNLESNLVNKIVINEIKGIDIISFDNYDL